MDLILGLLYPSSGRIAYTATTIKNVSIFISPRDVVSRGLVSFVPQDQYFLDKTLRETLNDYYSCSALNKSDYLSSSAINYLLKIVCLEEVFPNKQSYDNQLGINASKLSGGQRQRLSIACCLSVDPMLIVLDESLSMVDHSTSAKILSNIKTMTRTKYILVTHDSKLLNLDHTTIKLEHGYTLK